MADSIELVCCVILAFTEAGISLRTVRKPHGEKYQVKPVSPIPLQAHSFPQHGKGRG